MKIIRVGPDYETQLSNELVKELKPIAGDTIIIDRTSRGILVRLSYSWDDIFSKKLAMTKRPTALDISGVSGDDLLF